MNIAPLSPPPPGIGVTEPITPAYERVKQMLFKPFDLGKWFTIGFCAWLAVLGESGGFNTGYNFNSGGSHHEGGRPAESFRHFYFQARDYVLENIYWILPASIFLIILSLAIWVVLLWLNCRGKFMFLHCVALDTAEVQIPWQRYAGAANSLCWFRVGLGLAGMILMLPLLVFIAVIIVKLVMAGVVNVPAIMLTAGLAMGFVLLAVVFGIIRKFLVDFVVPIMFLRGGSCLSAWREFSHLLAGNIWKFALYLLFQIVLGMVIGMIVLLAILLTCCVAGCLMALPYVGTVLLLPVLIFQRSYALYYLAQYGPQYDVFPRTEPSSPPSVPSAFAPLAG
jgi:hypothetical protein